MSSMLNAVCAAVKKALPVLGATLALSLICLPAFPQAELGRISGTVSDQTGAVIPGATVTVADVQRGESRTLTTDGAGAYFAPTLLPGTYTVRVEFKGFKTSERQNVVVQTGQEMRVDLVLQPGESVEKVTVAESLPLVNTTDAVMGGTISNATINDMPLNGRDYQQLLTIRPGVFQYAGGGSWTQSTNGIRPDTNGWLLDGQLNADPAKDEAAHNECKAYGAAVIMRVPGRLHISWDNESTLRIETDAGSQVRMLHFGGVSPNQAPQWQGYSAANWQIFAARGAPPRGGYLKVVTTGMRPGYLRKSGFRTALTLS